MEANRGVSCQGVSGPQPLQNPESRGLVVLTECRWKAVDVPVPDTLIALQEELAESLESSLQAEATLEFIGLSLDTIVGDLNQVRKEPKPRIVRGQGADYSGKRTPLRVFEELILEYLTSMGGSAKRRYLMAWVEKKLRGRFQPGDLATYGDGKVVWKIRLSQARRQLVQAGRLRGDAPRGVWALDNLRTGG